MLDTYEIDTGTVLADRYEVIRKLGAGGMATVYLAEDRVLGRKVAVKRLRGERDETDAERFRREARLGATLSHANVVTVYDTVAGADGVLIVMEYVHGETLADALADGPLDDERAIHVLAAVAAALDHAHANGIVHRDVKPGNVLLGYDGTVKLADLGIATAVEATRITTAHDIVGTLAYIAPERLDSTFPGGPESDVYGLAVLAYEVLTGDRLSRGSTPAEVVHRATHEPPPDLREAWPQAPPAAARVLKAGMDRDPAKRPGSAGGLVEQLETALREDRDQRFALPPLPPYTEDSPPPPGRGTPRIALAAMVAIGLAGLAALIVAIASGGDGEPAGDTGTLLATDEPPAKEKPDKEAKEAAKEAAAGEPAPEAAAPAPAPAPDEAAATDEPVSEEPATASGGDPAALNDQGFRLIQSGRYDEAIPVLQRAVDAYGGGSQELTYAYALFNLGNALRLAGRPEEAIPVLEQRLQIPNQTGTVKRELDLARQQAGE